MSVQPNEPGTNPETNPEDQGNPAWQTILDKIPDPALQQLIRPELEQWDKSVQDKLQQVREPYQQYQGLVENNITKEDVEQALWIANQFNTDPKAVVEEAIKHFGLDYVPKGQVSSMPNSVEEDTDDDYSFGDNPPASRQNLDLSNDPAYKELLERVQRAEEYAQTQQEQEQAEQQNKEWQDHLEELHKDPKYGEFDDVYVTALVLQGATEEQAIASFKDTVAKYAGIANGQQQQNPPAAPVVMGGNSGSGTGIPANDVKLGEMKNGAINDLVAEFLAKNAAPDNT